MTRVIRAVGWTLVTAGTLVLLYVVYLLWFTGLETAQAQRSLQERFETRIAAPVDDDEPIEVGDAYAVLWFERDGEPVVRDEPLYVVEGTALADLTQGPGHYVDSAAPGEPGNTAIAGHRTTYGHPFWSLDDLQEGDTIHVVDRYGDEWVYRYVEQRIVQPTDVWVVEEPDPLGLDAPTITLTTCHPRYSAAQRLIVWGELIGEPREPDDRGDGPATGGTTELPGEG